ncbi:Squamous cell carcinoma antigen recognized by T-cells 3-like [Oopsacas minuta]|uniref:Squamous cell carcinoma antigen recognized by T-cells 3-like n=1 Tax=Oopsacas minuta TaxID=111878 RepID=A0AAV7JR53_9METZ|nr:Squamous cell carcinoma antigen recognized by T-cells 3-like [Oopsacas minuta]
MSGSLTACLERLQRNGEGDNSDKGDDSDDDDVSSSSSEATQDNELVRRIDVLERELAVNPMQYDKHLQLLKLLRGSPDLDRLRDARERMQSQYPLSVKLWTDWLKDEIPIAQISREAFSYVINLFDKAVSDYQSVQIWQLYAEFSASQMHQWGENGTSMLRQVYERAIEEVGVHFGEGDKIWELYIAMETMVFMGLQELQQTDGEDKQEEIREQVRVQYDHISKLYRMRLSIPMIPHNITIIQAREWDTDAVPDADTLRKVEDMYQTLLPHETTLNCTNNRNTIELYRAYMLAEQSIGADTDRIVCMYERCLAAHPLNEGVWIEYMRYCDKQVVKTAKLESVHFRAIRNVPWSRECWIGYMRHREKSGSAVEEIMTSVVQINFPNCTDLLEIIIEYISYLLRNNTNNNDVISHIAKYSDLLQERQGIEGDSKDKLKQMMLELIVRNGDVNEARKQWEDVILRHQDEVWFWFKYADFERHHGDVELERNVLLRGVANSKRPKELCDRLLEFERLNGTLNQVITAEEKCVIRESKVTEFAESSEGLFQSRQVLRAARKRVKRGAELVSRVDMNKKGIKGKKIIKERTRKVIKIAESSGSEDGVKSKQVRDVTMETPKKEQALPPVQESSSVMDTSQDPVPPQDQSNTVFISNLPYGASRDKIREIFVVCGEIVNIRLESKRNQSEFLGFGYVQFKEIESVTSALKLDRTMMNDRLLYVTRFVSKSCPIDMRPQKYDRVLDKKTLYLNKLPFDLDRGKLEEIVGGYGGVKQVRLMTTRKGKAKGWAYVEFEEETSAAKALLGLDQLQIGDNKISASISNPPPSKKRDDWITRKETGVKKVEHKKEPIPEQGKPTRKGLHDRKTQVMLLPRSVKLHTQGDVEMEQEISKGMSNEDFRQMMKK